jgi:hypothetical protein
MFIGGESGEGKSISALKLQQILMEVQGLDFQEFRNDINVFTPIEYPKKLDALLFDKRLKKVNIIAMHEAREIVKAKLWHSFLNQSISDVNAMSRAIKRLCIMIISQFIRDISTDIRYTLNYYIIVRRPKGQRARLYISVLWKDDRDLEKPKLRKRNISGYLVYPNGVYRKFRPKYLEVKIPDKEVVDWFEQQDYEAKAGIIRSKITKLIGEMERDIGKESKKVESMVLWYMGHEENLPLIGKMVHNKYKLKTDFREMHNLSEKEAQEFEIKLVEKMKEKGMVIQDGELPREQV